MNTVERRIRASPTCNRLNHAMVGIAFLRERLLMPLYLSTCPSCPRRWHQSAASFICQHGWRAIVRLARVVTNHDRRPHPALQSL